MPPETVIEAPVAEAPPPTEVFGSWVGEFGLEDVATEKTPLPSDAVKEGADSEQPPVKADSPKTDTPADGAKEEPAPDAAAKPVEVKADDQSAAAKPVVVDDPELAPEENELVRSRPAVEQPELNSKLKAARFWGHYLNPDVPAEDVRDRLEKKSPSRYAELETAVLSKRLANPTVFADELFASDPEQYGKLALEVFNSDPAYFTEQITGKKGVEPATVKTALDFWERNKDRMADQPVNPELTLKQKERLEQVRLYVGEDEAKELEAELKAARAPQSDDEEKEALRAKVAELEQSKTKEQKEAEDKTQKEAAEQQRVIQTERDEAWDAAYGTVETYVSSYADDPKDGLGLKVTDEERKLAPEVATLKDIKREIWLNGHGDLAPFDKGLGEWGKSRADFTEKLRQMGHFSQQREKDNAIDAARAIIPFADKYKEERLKAPIFAVLDKLITLATAGTNPKTENEAIIPGAPAASQQSQSSDPSKRMDDLIFQDALANG